MSEQILDVDDFMERVQGDKDLFFELLDIFIEDFHPKIQTLKEAFTNKDHETIEHVSHFLKGSCGNISAESLRIIFQELEKNSKDDNLQGSEKYLNEIDQKFEQLLACIGEIRTKLQ